MLALLVLAISADLAIQVAEIRPTSGPSAIFPVTVQNQSTTPIPAFELILTLRGDATLHAGNTELMTCTAESPQKARCRNGPALQPGGAYFVPVTISHISDRRLVLLAEATWRVAGEERRTAPVFREVRFPRTIEVTNNGDEGPGSLRAAIEWANANCTGILCEILFRLPVLPAPDDHPGAFARILLNTPLPPITAPDIIIDGWSQPGFDVDRLKVTLDGDALWYGSGLELAGTGVFTIRHLHVRRFPWDGIAVRRDGEASPFLSFISDNDIEGNGSRGITFNAPATRVNVERNAISGNGRSGVFVEGGRSINLDRNSIGGNGASGLYVSAASEELEIFRNSFGGNAHWGVTIGRGARLVELRENVFLGNRNAPIDVGIDGFDGFGYDPDHDVVGAPVVTSAVFDQREGGLVVTGTFQAGGDITIYASAAPGQAEHIAGHASVVGGGVFKVTLLNITPGTFITATGFHFLQVPPQRREWSTELSNSVRVE
jgi:hypothetical protein